MRPWWSGRQSCWSSIAPQGCSTCTAGWETSRWRSRARSLARWAWRARARSSRVPAATPLATASPTPNFTSPTLPHRPSRRCPGCARASPMCCSTRRAPGRRRAEERELLRHPLVGGVILFTRNYPDPEQLTALVGAIHAERTPPLIVAVDHEGGRVQRFRQGFSLLPPARRIGHEFDLDARAGLALSRAMGWLMAAELRAHGVDISFAPCVDLDHGVSFIGDRAFHALPDAVGQLAVAWMLGMRGAGMAGRGQDLPGHGAGVGGAHPPPAVDPRPP